MVRKAAGIIVSISWQILVCVLVFLFLYNVGTAGYEFGKEIFAPTSVSSGSGMDVIVIVEKGTSDTDISKLLQKKGLIKDWKVFWVQMKLYEADIIPGTYTLNTSMTSEEMLNLMEQTAKEESAKEKS